MKTVKTVKLKDGDIIKYTTKSGRKLTYYIRDDGDQTFPEPVIFPYAE